jgi:hypothetical protein
LGVNRLRNGTVPVLGGFHFHQGMGRFSQQQASRAVGGERGTRAAEAEAAVEAAAHVNVTERLARAHRDRSGGVSCQRPLWLAVAEQSSAIDATRVGR